MTQRPWWSSYETDSRINNDVRRGPPRLHHRASGRQNNLPVAGALQAHEHETFRVVTVIDTTSGQLIADLMP